MHGTHTLSARISELSYWTERVGALRSRSDRQQMEQRNDASGKTALKLCQVFDQELDALCANRANTPGTNYSNSVCHSAQILIKILTKPDLGFSCQCFPEVRMAHTARAGVRIDYDPASTWRSLHERLVRSPLLTTLRRNRSLQP